MATSVLYERSGSAAIVWINRPEDKNRVDRRALSELATALADARADSGVRSVILTAVGDDAFCTGGVPDGFPGGSSVEQLRFGSAFIGLQKQMAELGKPLIGAVNGDALAGGFALVASCDMAVAAEHARFGLPELQAGLFPMLALATVVHALPLKLVFELVYQGRLLTAAEAVKFHLVNHVVPRGMAVTKALELTRSLEALNPTAIAIGRNAYYAMVDMSARSALDYAQVGLVALLNSRDAQEADAARRSGRPPHWRGE